MLQNNVYAVGEKKSLQQVHFTLRKHPENESGKENLGRQISTAYFSLFVTII